MTKCTVLDCKEQSEWDFGDEQYCQAHWEEYTSWTYWESRGGYVQIEDDSQQAWLAAVRQGMNPLEK